MLNFLITFTLLTGVTTFEGIFIPRLHAGSRGDGGWHRDNGVTYASTSGSIIFIVPNITAWPGKSGLQVSRLNEGFSFAGSCVFTFLSGYLL